MHGEVVLLFSGAWRSLSFNAGPGFLVACGSLAAVVGSALLGFRAAAKL